MPQLMRRDSPREAELTTSIAEISCVVNMRELEKQTGPRQVVFGKRKEFRDPNVLVADQDTLVELSTFGRSPSGQRREKNRPSVAVSTSGTALRAGQILPLDRQQAMSPQVRVELQDDGKGWEKAASLENR